MTAQRKTTTVSLPAISMRGIVMFPSMILHFDVGRLKSLHAIKKAMEQDKTIFLVAQRDFAVDDPTQKDVYRIGTVAKIIQVMHTDQQGVRLMVEGLYRAQIVGFEDDGQMITCAVRRVGDQRVTDVPEDVETALVRAVRGTFEEYAAVVPKLPKEVVGSILSQHDPHKLFDRIVQNIFFQVEDKQDLLEERNYLTRLQMLVEILERETSIMSWERDIYDQVKDQMNQNQREYFLREQMRIIANELGEGDNPQEESMEYVDIIDSLKNMPEETKEKLYKECDKLYRMPSHSQEGQIIRTYIETCLELPWDEMTEEKADVLKAAKVLDRDHYGMQKVKDRILESIAVRKLAPEIKGQILCLVGPPGVGKTSVAKSVAEALGRKYTRISLGGVRDEADIRGHRKTYLGSMPGRIINAMRQVKSRNPLILLDEIDKMGADYKGDPSAAMLEVLDPEQNNSFRDHYIEVPFDLSDVLFITTANNASQIPGPLLDRMEIIEMGSYTREEKWHIARRHLIPKQIKRHGITPQQLKFQKSGIYALIDGYTREAGVRKLEQQIASVCRKAAKQLVDGSAESVSITAKTLEGFLGAPRYLDDEKRKKDEVGVVTGLAWTSVGGETMDIETIVLDGTGKLQITGSLGDVMTESAKIAVSLVRSIAEEYGIDPNFHKNKDLHIHAPEGAVPKDGPSAGVTMVTSIVSALSGRPVRRDIAMTGEITLHGKVLPIGGLKEKSMAAYRQGIETVFIPQMNRKDLEEVDSVVKEHVRFVPVDRIETILEQALLPQSVAVPKKPELPSFQLDDPELPVTKGPKVIA